MVRMMMSDDTAMIGLVGTDDEGRRRRELKGDGKRLSRGRRKAERKTRVHSGYMRSPHAPKRKIVSEVVTTPAYVSAYHLRSR